MQLHQEFQPFAANTGRRPSSDIDEAQPQDVLPDPIGFEASTPIKTPSGTVQIGDLRVGDIVTTHTGRTARIACIDRRHLSAAALHASPDAAPIRFEAGALPGMTEEISLLLSGDLPVTVPAVINGAETDATSLTQFPAKAFCDGGLIRHVIPEDGVHYVNLRLDGTHQICAAGIWVEADASCPNALPVGIPVQWHGRDSCEFRPLL